MGEEEKEQKKNAIGGGKSISRLRVLTPREEKRVSGD